ncbi:MAG: hypothetical protein ACRDVF_01575 [Microbacterium sp.]|uniref:hypothetical protein n=1 Tax=Microbacterium sp. TaxID=51671 RepID=UPI003D6EE5E4
MASHLPTESEMQNGDVGAVRLIIALDIDGVLSRQLDEVELRQIPDSSELPFGSAWVEDHRGVTRLVHTAPAVIAELDDIVQLPGVQLVWLTSAPTFLPRAIELAFGGRLTDGIVLADHRKQSNWKMTKLVGHVRSVGNPPYVWADATAIEFAFRVSPAFRNDDIGPRQRLLICPDPSIGLTLDDVEAIRDFGLDVLGENE